MRSNAVTASTVVTAPLAGAAVHLFVGLLPGAPTGTRNLVCFAQLTGVTSAAAQINAEVSLPPGRVSFEVDGVAIRIVGLSIYERDDVP